MKGRQNEDGMHKPEDMKGSYDTVVIGAGVAGLAAAMYAGRLNLKTLVLGEANGTEKPIGGVITLTEIVENYPGFVKLTGSKLAERIEKHALDYSDTVEVKEGLVTNAQRGKGYFVITMNKSRKYRCRTVIMATGTKWRKLPIKGAERLENRGVHYCALCDGPLMKKKIVAVVGGSDTAAKEALLLTTYARKVYIIYRGMKIRPEPVNAKRIEQNRKIVVITETSILELVGKKKLEKVLLDRPYKGKTDLGVDAVFGAIGNVPLSDLAKTMGVNTNKKGEIVIDRESNTNVKGVFAAGDVTDTEFKQAITGAAEGVHAAHSAYRYVKENEFVTPFYDREYVGGQK